MQGIVDPCHKRLGGREAHFKPGLSCASFTRCSAAQKTMLMAIAGVTVAVVLRPISMMRTPSSAPMRLLQLYSTAGANPSEYEEPEWCSVCAPAVPGAGGSVPLRRVLSLCWYTTSNASPGARHAVLGRRI